MTLRRRGQLEYSRRYPYQGENGEPAVAIHFCDCENDCGSSKCAEFTTDETGPIKVTSAGEPKPLRVTDTHLWTPERLRVLIDLVSCHVMERDNYLCFETQDALLRQAMETKL